jgi:hypothetical protein
MRQRYNDKTVNQKSQHLKQVEHFKLIERFEHLQTKKPPVLTRGL